LPRKLLAAAATYALFLNDLIEDDALRARVLMPFVTRLEGSADTPEAEKERAELIVLRTASAIMAPALLRTASWKLPKSFASSARATT